MFHHYEKLFADHPGWLSRAKTVTGKTRELSAFLVDVLEIYDVGARFDGRLTWHDACHGLRDLGITRGLTRVPPGALFAPGACDVALDFLVASNTRRRPTLRRPRLLTQ